MTKLTREHARKEGSRLQSCPMLAPQTNEGRREIVDCLMRHCQSEEHATSVMTEFLDTAVNIKGTLTSWLAAIALRTRVPDDIPPGCDRCYLGPDMSTGEVRWAAHVSFDLPSGYTASRRCTCDRGRWLSQRDAERPVAAPIKYPSRIEGDLEQLDWARRAAGEREP